MGAMGNVPGVGGVKQPEMAPGFGAKEEEVSSSEDEEESPEISKPKRKQAA